MPCIFTDPDDWYYEYFSGREEIEASKCLFSAALSGIAMEMVLALARSSHRVSYHILVMWSLLTPLDSLEDFIEENCACTRIHTEWNLSPPTEGFESAHIFDAWKADNRMQFKAVENAH